MKHLVFIVLLFLAGCVLVRDHGTYNRSDSVRQEGSNRINQLEILRARP